MKSQRYFETFHLENTPLEQPRTQFQDNMQRKIVNLINMVGEAFVWVDLNGICILDSAVKTSSFKVSNSNNTIRGFLSPRHGASPGLRMGE